jgi:hypothetical protein
VKSIPSDENAASYEVGLGKRYRKSLLRLGPQWAGHKKISVKGHDGEMFCFQGLIVPGIQIRVSQVLVSHMTNLIFWKPLKLQGIGLLRIGIWNRFRRHDAYPLARSFIARFEDIKDLIGIVVVC